VWLLYVLAWSVALEVPQPIHPHDPTAAEAVFTFGKAVHLSAYALLAGLTGWLRPTGAWRAAAFVFLLGHGVLTEVLQFLLPFGRTGAVADVMLDWVGISVGVALTWRWWFRPRGQESGVRGQKAEKAKTDS
jgi:VanZ family protein